MRTILLFTLLLFTACQPSTSDEQIPAANEEEVAEADDQDSPSSTTPAQEVDLNQPAWDLVTSAFQDIEGFPLRGSTYPLQTIVIQNDTLTIDGDACFHLPPELTKNFIEKHVDATDTLAVWFNENSKFIGAGTDFETGIYPVGKFSHAAKDRYIFYTLDDLTGRGSYDISYYVATADSQKWHAQCLGGKSWHKYNTHEYIDGEEHVKERRVSERNLMIVLEDDKLVIAAYSGDYAIDDEFDVFANGELAELTEIILP